MGHLRAGQHEYLALLFGEAQFAAGQTRRLQFPFRHVEFATDDARRLLLFIVQTEEKQTKQNDWKINTRESKNRTRKVTRHLDNYSRQAAANWNFCESSTSDKCDTHAQLLSTVYKPQLVGFLVVLQEMSSRHVRRRTHDKLKRKREKRRCRARDVTRG